MKNRRPEIVGDEIQKIVSTIISTKLKDPRVPLLTSVTSVKMSRDLSHATVFISVYGDEKTQKEAMEAIEHAKGFIRYVIDKTIKEDEARRLAREEREGKRDDSQAEE